MATSQKLTDRFLTCSVCMDVFDDPCTLQCYHTFCRKCATECTLNHPEAVAARSVPCPFCRKWTSAPDPGKPPEEWTKEMKPSFLIQGLMDSFGPGTKDTSHCSYCKGEGEITPATVWCSVCDEALCARCGRIHNRIEATKGHEIIGLSEEVKVKMNSKRKVMCIEHPTEHLEFLCKDCKSAACQKCCILKHRKCDYVVQLETALSYMKSELASSKETYLKKACDAKCRLHKCNSEITELAIMHSQAESDIKATIRKAKEAIASKENILLGELSGITENQLGKLQSRLKTGEMAMQIFQHQAELIQRAIESDCEMDVYEIFKSCESTGGADFTHDDPMPKFNFSKPTDLHHKLQELNLGHVEVIEESQSVLKAVALRQNTIDIKVPGDENPCYPFDVIALVVDDIDVMVVTDCNNCSIKSFFNKDNHSGHSKFRLSKDPWSVTELPAHQVAVTVPEANQIVIAEVTPELKLVSALTTENSYWGITSLSESTFAASSREPPSVDILSLSGTKIKSILLGSEILQNPSFITTTMSKNILISDNGKKSVLCFTQSGQIIFDFSPTGEQALHEPVGITVTKTGDILVADCSLHSVLHLTETGDFVRNILTSQDGLALPCGLCTDRHERLCLSLLGQDFQIVQMYKLSK